MHQLGVIVGLTMFLIARPAAAQLYYASTTMGAPNQTGGLVVYSDQFPAVRFDVMSTSTVTAVGGHFKGSPGLGNGQLFGALVQLSSHSDYPNSTDLSTPDVLSQALFAPPTGGSQDLIIPIGPVTLAPGTYGLVFGSGRFGATGSGIMPANGTPIGSPDYFILQDDGQWHEGTPPVRMTVYVPEPAGVSLIAVPIALLGWRRRSQPAARARTQKGARIR